MCNRVGGGREREGELGLPRQSCALLPGAAVCCLTVHQHGLTVTETETGDGSSLLRCWLVLGQTGTRHSSVASSSTLNRDNRRQKISTEIISSSSLCVHQPSAIFQSDGCSVFDETKEQFSNYFSLLILYVKLVVLCSVFSSITCYSV